jgi:purine-cytosine permease-like protein
VDAWQERGITRDPQHVPAWHAGALAWVLGVLASVPFWNQAWFVGPFARAFPQDGDISYYVGLLIAALAMAALKPRRPAPEMEST